MANLDATPVLNRIHALLTTGAGGHPVYQRDASLPESLPPSLYVLQALFNIVDQQWAERRSGDQHIQILCCATGPGTAKGMVQTVNERLPAGEFHIDSVGTENKSDSHYQIPVTVRVVT